MKNQFKGANMWQFKTYLVNLLKSAPNSMILCGSIAFHSSLYRLNKSPKASAPSSQNRFFKSKSFSPIHWAWLSAPLAFCIASWGLWFHFSWENLQYERELISDLPSVTIVAKVLYSIAHCRSTQNSLQSLKAF